MGFFDKLADTWTHWNTWDTAWNDVKQGGQDWGRGFMNAAAGAFNLAMSIGDTNKMKQAIGQYWSGIGNIAGGTGSILGGIGEFPGLNQIVNTAMWVQEQGVKRPLSTYYQVGGDTLQRGVGTMFSGDEWRQAYDASEHVSAGQAFAYAGLSGSTVLSKLAGVQPLSGFDPRTPEGQQAYHDNMWLKAASGTVDAGVTMFADPTIMGGKYARLTKLKYVSKVMDSAAIAKRGHIAYVDSNAYGKLKNFITDAPNPDLVHRVVFNNHDNGGAAANLLWAAAKAEDQVPGLYDKTWLALYGDPNSWQWLTENAPAVADATGSKFANYTIASNAKLQGVDPAADFAMQALRETKTQAFSDALVNMRGLWGQAPGLLIDQPTPRLTMTSRWRDGIHQWANFAPPTVMGNWPRAKRLMLPSSRTGRMLNLEDPNSVNMLRSSLESSRLDAATVSNYVSAYARATSRESRYRIYNDAENAAFIAHAGHYGMSPGTARAALPQLNQWRSRNRDFMAATKRYMSDDIRAEAERRLNLGDQAGADAATQMADQVDQAVKRGDMPAAHYGTIDEDGNLAMVPEDGFHVDPHQALLLSQHATVVPMVDWHVLDSALWWKTRGALGEKVYQGKEALLAALEAANSVWKITAILRPGYIWRTMSDELGGPVSIWGSTKTFMSAVEGAKNAAVNTLNRGQYAMERMGWAKARAKAFGAKHVFDGQVMAEGTQGPSNLAIRNALVATRKNLSTDADLNVLAQPLSDGVAYSSYDKLLADGVMSVQDVLGRVAAHAQHGTLPQHLMEQYAGRQAGILSDKEYQRYVVDSMLNGVGRGVYQSPAWQQALVDLAVEKHAAKKAGETGVIDLVDPFTGTNPKIKGTEALKYVNLRKSVELVPNAAENAPRLFNHEDVYDYIANNIDDLLHPHSILAAYITPEGKLSLNVAQLDPKMAKSLRTPLKPTDGRRVSIPFVKGKGALYQDSGAAPVVVNTPSGPISFTAAFEGGQGDVFRKMVTSTGAAQLDNAWQDLVTSTEHARLMATSRDWVNSTPDRGMEYDLNWQRAVLQLANDPVARQFMSGATADRVLAWMRNTDEGRAYNAKMGVWRSRYAEQVKTIQTMVDQYLPFNPDRPQKSATLRVNALKGKATIGDLGAVVPRDQMPQVHGPSLDMATNTGVWMRYIQHAVDKTFTVLSEMPNDKLLRMPFAADRYGHHLTELTHGFLAANPDRETFSVREIQRLEDMARRRALKDVHTYLYDTTATFDVAKMARLIVPFGSAILDSGRKWGLVLRENPARFLNVWKVWSAPDRNGLVQDENGNHLVVENGRDVWYQVDPKTGARTRMPNDYQPKNRYIVFRLPHGIQPKFADNALAVSYVDKNVFKTFLDMPSFGPLVAVPVNNFSLSHPEFADNKLVRTFILPYGPTSSMGKAVMPGNLRNLWDTWVSDDPQVSQLLATSVYATEMANYSQGKRLNAPTFEEARQKAASLRGLQFWYRFAGVSTNFKTPYQPYVDYYHMLRVQAPVDQASGKDPRSADERFYADMGPEFFPLTAAVTRNTLGLPATVGAFNQYRKFSDLMQKYPDLAPLISGAEGAGSFSKAVYEAQRITPVRYGSGETMREQMSMEESIQDAQRRQGWIEYSKFMDALHADMAALGVTSLQQKKAAGLKMVRDQWLQQHTYWQDPYGTQQISPWYQEFSTFDSSKMASRLNQMRQVIQDPRLQGRDDIRGLIEYLDARDQFKSVMKARGYATLDSKKATWLSEQWASTVFGLKNDNLSFAALYDRWLTADERLEA